MELNEENRNWNELKLKLKTKYPQLTETDLQDKAGKKENTLRMIEYKLSKTKQELQEIISELIIH
jgi:hypothetical protein